MAPGPHGRDVRARPRMARMATVSTSMAVTLVALLGGLGVVPTGSPGSSAYAGAEVDRPGAADHTVGDDHSSGVSRAAALAAAPLAPGNAAEQVQRRLARYRAPAPTVPARTGTGKRVVFDVSDQRVWLVGPEGRVQRTYLVSGSVYDNLDPGQYAVYSRSRHAVGIADSGTMDYMVRFAHGNNAAIGFHDIPVKDGARLQTRGELGTPTSHGCIRQAEPDAKALWRFAPEGTPVAVTA